MGVAEAIGVLSPFVGGTYYGALVTGAAAAAESHGRRLIAIQTLDAAADLAVNGGNPAFDLPVACERIGGYVVFADAATPDYLAALGKPVILAGHTVPGLDRPSVLADNAAGMRDAVTHLIRVHGCRHIAFTGYLEASDIRERYNTFLEVLETHGLREHLLLPTENNLQSGVTWTARDLLRYGRPDALVAATDRNAIGANRVLAEAGLFAPDDYLLTGFDDIELARTLQPELASIGQPLEAMSRLAVDLVLRQLSGEHVPIQPARLPTRFVPRTSCGCTAFADVLPELVGDDAEARLRLRLAKVVTLRSQEQAPRAAVRTAHALVAVAAGDRSGIPAAADELQALLAARPTLETLRVLCRSLQEFAADLRTGDLRAVDRCVQDITLVLAQAHNRIQLGDHVHLRSVINVNYALGRALLHRRDTDPRDPSWLAMTSAAAGSIALRGPSGELTRTPGWRRTPGPAIPAGPTTVDAFPPSELVAAAGPGETVFVVRAKVGDSDRGWLALVDTVENRVQPGRDLTNQCAALLTVALDLRDQEEQLQRAARSDRLTGLPNRASFVTSLEAAIGCRDFVVLFLDLDGFKGVNDTLGHQAGDLLLIHVADRIRQCLRGDDVAARFGGDEFLILLADVSPGPVLDQLIDRVQAAICAPYEIDGEAVRIGVSIGCADGVSGVTVEQLLQHADTAMYQAKAAGKAATRRLDRVQTGRNP